MSLFIPKDLKIETIKETIKALTDEENLAKIAQDDDNLFEIRDFATKQITDNEILKGIVFDSSNTSYTKDNKFDIRESAVKQITNDETLFEIVNDYYDETVNTKYGLNVVKNAVKQVNSENMLIDISESNYDKEVIENAVQKLNKKHEDHDKVKLTVDCDDDSKFKRMNAIDQIADNEILLDIAMNAEYFDVREKALSKLSMDNEVIITLNDLIKKEKDYQNAVYVSISSNKTEENEENEKLKKVMSDKAKEIGIAYGKLGNTKKEKFYNEQCKLYQ